MSKPVLYLELTELLNRNSRENESNTPDFILAQYMMSCLEAFERATFERDKFHNINVMAFSHHLAESSPPEEQESAQDEYLPKI